MVADAASRTIAQSSYLERETGVEPATLALARRCSTTELLPLKYLTSISAGAGWVNSTGPWPWRDDFGVFGRFALSMCAGEARVLLQQVAVPDMQNTVADRSGLGIVRDHEHRLLKFLVRAAKHGEHRV